MTDNETPKTWRSPAVDIYETEEGLTLIAELPGVERDALDLAFDRGTLTLEGRSDDIGYRRRFRLPEHLDAEEIAAELKDGVLTVRLPRAAGARARKIEVSIH